MFISNLICIFLPLLYTYAFGAKNVLFVVVDDLRPSIRGYGIPNAYTPNIDNLIRSGIAFHKAYAQLALCAPSRNSFLTSRRPDTLKLYDFYSYWREAAGNYTTLPQYFKENLYDTKSIGKVFHPGVSSNHTDDYPLSWTYSPWHPPSEIYKNYPVCPDKNGWHTNIVCPVRLEEQPGETLPDIESLAEAKLFLKSRKNSKKPFFLALGFHKPHIPMKFPREFLDYYPLDKVTLPTYSHYPPGLPEVAWNPWTDIRWRHDIHQLNLSFPFQEIGDNWSRLIRQSYFASVSYIDSLIGKLLKALEKNSLHENTVVVLVGDHVCHEVALDTCTSYSIGIAGWSLGEHGEWSKYSNFDVAVRVPLIIRIPNLKYRKDKNLTNGVHIGEIVELVDLFPTIVSLAGLKPIPKCPRNSSRIKLCTEGMDLVPLILDEVYKGKQTPGISKKNRRALSQYPRPGLFPTEHPNSDKPRLKQIKIMGYSIRTMRYRYTEWIEWNPKSFSGNWSNVYEVELYDHHIDPEENLNIAGRPGMQNSQKMLSIQLRREFSH